MREKSDPMLPYHCYGLDDFRHEYDAIARVDTDGCWYKREEVDAELAALRAERDQFKAMWERDSTALGKALAQRDTARTDAEDKRARVAELEKALQFMLNVFGQDGLGDGAEGDAVEHARKAMRLPSNKEGSRDE